MSRSTLALGALLAVSAALNVLLLARGRSEPPRPAAERPRAAREVATSPGDVAVVEALEARVRELEAEKRILAEPAPGVDRLAEFRSKLRQVVATQADPSHFHDPLSQLTYSEVSLEISRLTLGRSKDPKAYAEMLRAVYEAALERPPLPDDVKARITRAFDDLGAALTGLKADSAGERRLREIEVEADMIERVRRAIGPERADKLSEDSVLYLTDQESQTYFLDEKSRDQHVIDTWARMYALNDAQKEASRTVARAFNAELIRLGGNPTNGIFPPTGSPEAYKLRLDVLRAQMNALQQIEGGWTAEQRERFRTRTPLEFMMLNNSRAVDEEEK